MGPLKQHSYALRNAYIYELGDTDFMKQEIHFVTGKGGVGKSVVAAGLALRKSREGKKVLLVELGDQSFFKDFFNEPDVAFKPRELKKNLDVALWSGETSLREYAKYLIKVEALTKLFFENAVMRAFINVAPALSELAIMGKITSGPRDYGPLVPYDCLVVDAYATGHFMALMRASKGMAQAIQFGPMGEQSRSIDTVLRNQDICHYHIVTLPEELPVREAEELKSQLANEFSLRPQVILNKFLETSVPLATLKEAQKDATSDLGRFALYLEQHQERQRGLYQETQKNFDRLIQVPLFFETDPWKLVELISERMV